MLIKERLQIWCRGNNGFNPHGIECNIILLSFYIILINSSPPPQCHIYAQMNKVIIDPGNDLSPIRRQAITWNNAG